MINYKELEWDEIGLLLMSFSSIIRDCREKVEELQKKRCETYFERTEVKREIEKYEDAIRRAREAIVFILRERGIEI